MLKAARAISQDGWGDIMEAEFSKPYMQDLQLFLKEERVQETVYPAMDNIFHALERTALADVRVVILGQDPYHGEGQAHGLAFSVPRGVKPPPSLKNIYKELARSMNVKPPAHGDLSAWADEGVLLLNTTLTVRAGQAASHAGKGWDVFTDSLIRAVNERCEHVVFMLWGSHAQKKGAVIDSRRHLILEAPHPSPLSAHRGFIGCDHFVRANEYLDRHGKGTISWSNEI